MVVFRDIFGEKENRMQRGFIHFVAALGILGLLSSAQAAVVTLTMTFTPSASSTTGTWRVFGSDSLNDNAGIADYALSLGRTGGITITSSTQNGPRVADDGNGNVAGFGSFRSNGTLGVGMTSAQDVIGFQDPIDVIQGVGQHAFIADFSSNGTGGGTANIAFPVLLASGGYANDGTGGTITANVTPGSFINVLNGTGFGTWQGPANVSGAQVVPGGVSIPAVPEPATIGLLAVGMIGFLGRRRQA